MTTKRDGKIMKSKRVIDTESGPFSYVGLFVRTSKKNSNKLREELYSPKRVKRDWQKQINE